MPGKARALLGPAKPRALGSGCHAWRCRGRCPGSAGRCACPHCGTERWPRSCRGGGLVCGPARGERFLGATDQHRAAPAMLGEAVATGAEWGPRGAEGSGMSGTHLGREGRGESSFLVLGPLWHCCPGQGAPSWASPAGGGWHGGSGAAVLRGAGATVPPGTGAEGCREVPVRGQRWGLPPWGAERRGRVLPCCVCLTSAFPARGQLPLPDPHQAEAEPGLLPALRGGDAAGARGVDGSRGVALPRLPRDVLQQLLLHCQAAGNQDVQAGGCWRGPAPQRLSQWRQGCLGRCSPVVFPSLPQTAPRNVLHQHFVEFSGVILQYCCCLRNEPRMCPECLV